LFPSSCAGLHCDFREPVAQPISKLAFEFDRRKLTMEDVRELIYKEILEYHPNALRVGWGPCKCKVQDSCGDKFKHWVGGTVLQPVNCKTLR
jgi:hypothetical protein